LFLAHSGWVVTDVVRSYLIYRLLTKHDQPIEVILGFYYTGHSINTIKIVREQIELNQYGENASEFLYAHALNFLYTNRANDLSDEDTQYLKGFFQQGQNQSNLNILASSQMALARIDVIQLGE